MSNPRRKLDRFDMKGTGATLSVVQETAEDSKLEPGSLLDLSYLGMSFSLDRPLRDETLYEFRIDLTRVLGDVAVVKARVRWVQQRGPKKWVMGAEFQESSKAWLGPQEE